ncbi:MAG: MoaA/NifB/PqqE/SkfB family radical SAM enzyme [Myxococcota bacterium]|jgi:MoaA/NifB/PqqE/SkfB family radical SAM enzyme
MGIRQELPHAMRLGKRLVNPVGDGPALLVQFITSRCNAHCDHCFDTARQTEENAARDLTLEELTAIASKMSQPYFTILTGGEPFLRKDVGQIILNWATNARPRVLALPTNGSRPEYVAKTVEWVLPQLPADVYLSINVSLDGVGDLHDELRGTPGLFAKACKTIGKLQELAKRHDNLGVGVVSVMSAQNQHVMEDIMDFVLDDLGLEIWAPFLVRGEPRDPESLKVDIRRYEEVSRRFEQRISSRDYGGYKGFVGARLNSAKNVARRAIIAKTVREDRRIVPCSAGRHSAVIYADGGVFACEIQNFEMGNLRDWDYDLSALWRSAEAEAARTKVDCHGCVCTHENVLTTSVAYAWRQWPAIAQWTTRLMASGR